MPQPSCSTVPQDTVSSVTPDHDDLKAALDELLNWGTKPDIAGSKADDNDDDNTWIEEPVIPADIGKLDPETLAGILTDTELEDEIFEPVTPPSEKRRKEDDDSPLAQRE
ncbi:hypothetical protein CBL_20825 [Carabus blaptoides fortunei]